MARNILQILGNDKVNGEAREGTLEYMKNPVDFVICYTPDGCNSHLSRNKETGGTGQAISIANHLNIPIFNLKNTEYIKKLDETIEKIRQNTYIKYHTPKIEDFFQYNDIIVYPDVLSTNIKITQNNMFGIPLKRTTNNFELSYFDDRDDEMEIVKQCCKDLFLLKKQGKNLIFDDKLYLNIKEKSPLIYERLSNYILNNLKDEKDLETIKNEKIIIIKNKQY